MEKKRKAAAPKKAAPKLAIEAPAEEGGEVATIEPGDIAVNPEMLLVAAIKNKLPVEALERLMALRKELKAEWAKEQYFADLAGFQAECPVVKREKIVLNKDKTERYRYAPIEDILKVVVPLLLKHGFSWTTKIAEQGDGSVTATTEAHHRDGHMEPTTIRVPIDPAPGMNKPQAVVSAFSYARRVSFIGAFGITTDEDDDGAAAGKEIPENVEPPRASEQPGGERNVTPTTEAKQEPTPAPKAAEPPKKAPEPTPERKLPDDPAFKDMKKPGVEAYWLLRDAFSAKLLGKDYCEKQGARLRNNNHNEEFLASLKETIEKDIGAARAAKIKATGKES